VFIRNFTKFELSITKLVNTVFVASFLITGAGNFSNVYADDYSVDSAIQNSAFQKSQAANFFLNNEGNQNFFSNRNLSSNTIFNNQGEPSLITNSVIEKPPVGPSVVNEAIVAETPEAKVVAPEESESARAAQNIDESVLAKNSNVDPSLRDVMEHSRKIREAIFGEEAASKLPKGIREKLQGKFPEANPKSTRF